MTLIEQIKRDREAGTPGPWDNTGTHGLPTEFGVYADGGRSVCSTGSYYDGSDRTYHENVINAKRCARVPAMEEALLAAVEAMTLVQQATDKLHKDGMKPGWGVAKDLMNEALAIHRKALEPTQ